MHWGGYDITVYQVSSSLDSSWLEMLQAWPALSIGLPARMAAQQLTELTDAWYESDTQGVCTYSQVSIQLRVEMCGGSSNTTTWIATDGHEQ